ncbi:DUF2470 domain-containing protein [Streptomyces himalayensis]|uniref:DUF2470 domain-containing protein n=1 Tax=Streptomyces himalayensis subsp. himalayensis TaxID=2756131 RepID=A0A7W0IA00_9ACTN|nr:DUF2470 domain-containing protein [Streptomyces himalayensis]MBA2947601.1 DUF2470 domain-containing protein [Streptomyces himalayensis subsp. himalayensis]
MNPTTASVTAPTAAERIRSVLARAGSLTLTTDGHRYDLVGLHTVDSKGQVTLRLPADSPLAARTVSAPRGALAALLEFTDISPTPVRARVRAKVTLSGWLALADGTENDADDSAGLRLDLARATLETGEDMVAVGLDELVLAEADPLAIEEAAMLTHLADAHQDMVAKLSRLAGPRLLQGVVRVQPVALDRYAITLRCEYARGHCDLRLLFPQPVHDAAQAGAGIQNLLAAGRNCPHRHPTSSRP